MRSRRRPRAVIRGMDGVYHLMSRTSCRQHLFGDEEKAMFVRMMRRQALFCGVDVLAYCMMSNHFHLLVRVRHQSEISDQELLRRHRVMYAGERLGPRAITPERLETLLNSGSEEADQWRDRLRQRMGDVSVFMRELKQRFGIWYNHRHENQGSIWSDRFKSLIVEPSREAMSTVAAYIDLNPVRAGLVQDPADYRFSSYGAAMGGRKDARTGYTSMYFGKSWKAAIRSYRMCLYGRGYRITGNTEKASGRIPVEKVEAVLANKGKLEFSEVLRCRIRYFSDGMAIGSAAYLNALQRQNPQCFSRKRKVAYAMMQGADWGELRVVRNLRVAPLG